MSLFTWKAEFYPVTAKAASGDALTAARHSLAKWRGLRKEALERHGMAVSGALVGIVDVNGAGNFRVDGASCALCRFSTVGTFNFIDCGLCPLYGFTGATCCADDDDEDGGPTAYEKFAEGGDPEPMITALEGTVKMLEARDDNHLR